MNYLLKLGLLLYSMIMGSAEANESACHEFCNAPFGEVIGQSFLTKAYSNCNGDCVKNENNYVVLNNRQAPVFSGMKWQCVEYARRWLIENRSITFSDVEYAYHIWDLNAAERLDTHAQVLIKRFKNKRSIEAPQVGDLLIYSVKLAITGHVSVVVGVERDSITIAEQNYFNRSWEGHDYARRLLMAKDEKGRYRIFDDALIGWVRMQ